MADDDGTKEILQGLRDLGQDLRNSRKQNGVSWQTLGIFLGPIVLVLGFMQNEITKLEEVETNRDARIEQKLADNTAEDKAWRLRVSSLDPVQSAAIEANDRMLHIIWNRTIKTEPYPGLLKGIPSRQP